MKIIYFVFLFFILSIKDYAQSKKTDSLFAELKKWENKSGIAADTNLYNVYCLLGSNCKNSNPDTAIYFLDKSIAYAKKLQNGLKEGASITQKGWCYYLKGDFDKSFKYYQQSLTIIEKYMVDSVRKNEVKLIKAGNFSNIGAIYSAQGYEVKAIDYYFKALSIYSEIKDIEHQGTSFSNIGSVYNAQGDYIKALDYYIKASKIFEGIGNKSNQAVSFINIGVICMRQSNYVEALDYYFKALKIFEKTGNKRYQTANLGYIGVVYKEQENYSKALSYFFEALKIAEETENKLYQSENLGNIGVVYNEQRDYVKALSYYTKALKIAEEIGSKKYQSSNYSNIGLIYFNQAEYVKSLDFYLKALKIDEEMGNKEGQSFNLGYIGKLYVQQKKYQEADVYLRQAIQLGEELGMLYYLGSFYQSQSELYTQTGKHKEALGAYKKYVSCRDSVMSKENQKASVQKEMQYDFDKKEALQKAEQDKKDILAKEELKKQTLQRNGFIIGFVLMLLLTGVVFRSYRNKQKANKIISEQKTIVEQQKHIIEERHKEITDSINYAERIQRSFLATREMLDSNLNRHSKSNGYTTPNSHAKLVSASEQIPKQIRNDDNDYFIFFKPKDVVSGDFYWAASTSSATTINKQIKPNVEPVETHDLFYLA
ncbi:MAG: tetratricopeptide repeat protein, partial [Bacteroidetes bacterium]|nr:tetratricopeptide repeat protein [Bacteroidota bacterium]